MPTAPNITKKRPCPHPPHPCNNPGVKLFISYPHDENENFIRHLAADLRLAGHDPRIDRAFIPPGHDWRRRITAEIRDTDWTLAFLSPHALKPKSVSRDEIDITIGEKGWALTPIVVEKVRSAEIPPAARHIQTFDLSAWRTQGKLGSRAFNAWYKPELEKLKAFLAQDHNAAHAAQMATLQARLNPPTPQHAEIARHAEGFIGREWLLAALESWRHDPARNRLLWLSAAPGMGKTAFASWLAHTHRANIVAIRLCEYGSTIANEPGAILRAIAYQIARRLPDYRDILLRNTEKPLPQNPQDLATTLLKHPLGPAAAIDGSRARDPFLVVIDGLDETVISNASLLTTILTKLAPDLPSWLALMVTSRPDSPVGDRLAAAHPLLIPHDSPKNSEDLEDYARAWLPNLPNPPADLEAATQKIVAASEGNITYLVALRLLAATDPESLDRFPPGLGALYLEWFERQFPSKDAYFPTKQILDILTAARTPIPPALLAEAAGVATSHLQSLLCPLGSLLAERSGGLTFFHLSLRDWLMAKPPFRQGSFTAAPHGGRDRLFPILWRAFLAFGESPLTVELSKFAQVELPAMIEALSIPSLTSILLPESYEPARRGAGICVALSERARDWENHLAWLKAFARIVTAISSPNSHEAALAHLNRGDLLRRLGRTTEALNAYHEMAASAGMQRDLMSDIGVLELEAARHERVGQSQLSQGNQKAALQSMQSALAIAYRLIAEDPTNANMRHNISSSHEMIGEIQESQGNFTAAIESHQAALAVAHGLVAEHPGNIHFLRRLSAMYERVGATQEAQGNLGAALETCQVATAIAQRIAAEEPDNLRWQLDLSISYRTIGHLLQAMGNLQAALLSFEAAKQIAVALTAAAPEDFEYQGNLSSTHASVSGIQRAQGNVGTSLQSIQSAIAISRRLATKDPTNTKWQYDLSILYGKLGDLQFADREIQASLESFEAAMAISKKLIAIDPANTEWQRGLAIDLNRIGDVRSIQGNFDAATQSYQSAIVITQSLNAADPSNTQWKRDLSLSHAKLGDMERARGDLAAAQTFYRTCLRIETRLTILDPSNSQWQHDLSVTHDRIGDTERSQGNLKSALESYKMGMEIVQRLADLEPANAQWQRGLVVSHQRLAGVYAGLNDRIACIRSCQGRLSILSGMEARGMHLDPQASKARQNLPHLIDAVLATTTATELRLLFTPPLPPLAPPTQPQSAIPAFRAALARNALAEAATILATAPPSPDLPNARAVLALRQGNPVQALQHLTPVLLPNNATTPPVGTREVWITNYATAHALAGNVTRAERALEWLESRNPPTAQRLRAAIATARKSQTLLQRLKGAPLPPIQLENPGEL